MIKNRFHTILLCAFAVSALFLLTGPFSSREGTQASREEKDAVFSQFDTGEEETEIVLKSGGGSKVKARHSDMECSGVDITGDTITITRKGRYRIQGALKEGRLRVEAGKDEPVVLVLSGVEISNSKDAAIYIKKAGNTLLYLEENTLNQVRSGDEATARNLENAEDVMDFADKDDIKEASGAAVYAKADLTLAGNGTLKVTGGINNGIHTKKNLVIEKGTLEVRALNHGIKGTDSVTIKGGSFFLFCGGKGVLSDTRLAFLDGDLEVAASYEGMEANQILISGGKIDIAARDDGINANGEPVPPENQSDANQDAALPNLVISGGEIHINARGDGLDSNGNIYIEGGTTLIDGPESDKDGPLDYGYENGGVCLISGGTVLAIGSSGMAQTFGENSSQYSFLYIWDSPYKAGSRIRIYDQADHILFEHTTIKKGASVVFSSPKLKKGEICILEIGDQRFPVAIE